MDGGRRLLGPLSAARGLALAGGFAAPALAGARGWLAPVKAKPLALRRSERLSPPAGWRGRAAAMLARPGVGFAFALLVLGGAGVAGAVRGGHYAAFVASHGAPADLAARALGFGVAAMVITADNGLTNDMVLRASGVDTNASLPFIDVAGVREKLKAVPMVKEASVRKLYPDRLVIDVEARQPFALWQKDGQVRVVSQDGVPIDALSDAGQTSLPFVVGDGANERVAEYARLLEASGDLRARIRAGVLVAGRRWDLKMTGDVDVKLPEKNPERALAALAELQRDAHVLDRDVVFLDFRLPGRMVARLTEEAADARAAVRALKKTTKAGMI